MFSALSGGQGMGLIEQALRLSDETIRLLTAHHLAVEGGAIQGCLDLRGERVALRGQVLNLPLDGGVGRIPRVV